MVEIEKLSDIFSKVAYNLHQRSDPPQQQPVTKSASIPHKVRSTMTKLIPSEQPNIIQDDDGNSSTSFQQNVHMSPSCTHSILPEVPVLPPRVQPAQPPSVDTEWPSSNLRSIGKKNPIPNFALTVQFEKVKENSAVTHQVSGFAQEYRHLVKGSYSKIWERSFANELGKLTHGIRAVKGANTVIFIPKTQVPKD